MIFFAALILAAVLTFIIVRIFTNARSGKALAQFELPADSDKESFLDQKTGKRYDREAYQSYLTKTVQRMTDPQLQNLSRSRGDGSVWHELLMEAVDAERNRRRAAAEAACAEDEEAMEELCGEIALFSGWNKRRAHRWACEPTPNCSLFAPGRGCRARDLIGISWQSAMWRSRRPR